MKNLVLLFAFSLSITFSFAQIDTEPQYTIKGKLIEATLYHNNGAIAQTGYYTKCGKLQGEWNSFDAQGNKTATAFYNKGEKVGTWVFYNGNEMKKVSFNDSKIIEVNTWELKDTRVVSN